MLNPFRNLFAAHLSAHFKTTTLIGAIPALISFPKACFISNPHPQGALGSFCQKGSIHK